MVGIPILCVAGAFIVYSFSQYYYLPMFGLRKIIYQLFYTTNGIIGTPVNVCSTYIVLFILFGAFLEATGISQFFIQCANSIAGASSGGRRRSRSFRPRCAAWFPVLRSATRSQPVRSPSR